MEHVQRTTEMGTKHECSWISELCLEEVPRSSRIEVKTNAALIHVVCGALFFRLSHPLVPLKSRNAFSWGGEVEAFFSW